MEVLIIVPMHEIYFPEPVLVEFMIISEIAVAKYQKNPAVPAFGIHKMRIEGIVFIFHGIIQICCHIVAEIFF